MNQAKSTWRFVTLLVFLGAASCLSNDGRGLRNGDSDDVVNVDGQQADLGVTDTSAAVDTSPGLDTSQPIDIVEDSSIADVAETVSEDVMIQDTDEDMDDQRGGEDIQIVPECVTDEECMLAALVAPCFMAVCVEGKCQVIPMADNSLCDDGNLCTDADRCVAATCTGVVKDCNDGNPCTVDTCMSADGSCVQDTAGADQIACDDGDACTTNDVCAQGGCGGTPVNCQDNNPCTVDTCSSATGACVFDSVGADGQPCDDDDVCTQNEVCGGGTCGRGSQICACENDVDCPDDGDLCNGTYVCKTDGPPETWTCVVDPATVVVCPVDGDTTCLKNQCDKLTAQCAKQPVGSGLTCDDLNACTLNDVCDGAGQCVGVAKVCADGLACTTDACGADGACNFAISPTTCLISGNCYASGALMPGNGCLSCQPGVDNKTFSPNVAPCDDGNGCTVSDGCDQGSCKPGTSKVCNDGDPCTNDSCQAPSGQCVYVDNGSCPTYVADIQPIFLNRCGGCHEGTTNTDCLGGTCLTTFYGATQLPSYYCVGKTVGACCLERVLDGTMPDGFGCTGKPAQDAAKPYCLVQSEIDLLDAWIKGGQPEE